MSLPEIPEEAIDAMRARWSWTPRESHVEVLAAVWPHLYAAALRHAAEHLGDPIPGVDPAPVSLRAVYGLHYMADQAAGS